MDLHLSETGNGGDLQLKGNDLCVINGFENMPYLGLFGGNVQASTNGPKIPTQQAFDWWGNNLFSPNNQGIQFNSLLEKKLNELALNSAGRIQIEDTIKNDLKFMDEFADINITAIILATDKIKITLSIKEPGNLQAKEFIYIWQQTYTDDDSTCLLLVDTLGDFNHDFNHDFL